jgi:hypothetical protein
MKYVFGSLYGILPAFYSSYFCPGIFMFLTQLRLEFHSGIFKCLFISLNEFFAELLYAWQWTSHWNTDRRGPVLSGS